MGKEVKTSAEKRGAFAPRFFDAHILERKEGSGMRGWNCGGFIIGICALALGLGILIAAVFPVGCLMFLVAFLLIACGIACLKNRR